MKVYPVIGPLSRHASQPERTTFNHFDNGKVYGLAAVDGASIQILAVGCHVEGRGYFREFASQLKSNYNHIRFWAVMNPKLDGILRKYGFISGHDVDEYGEFTECHDWRSLNNCLTY